MYRVLQSLEREPNSKIDQVSSNLDQSEETDVENNLRRPNPHKYLLYRPTFAQLMVYICTAFKDVDENSALLIYLSADGAKSNVNSVNRTFLIIIEYNGGIQTTNSFQKKQTSDFSILNITTETSLVHCLHPQDLVPFTRKPLFLIVDSTNSNAFNVTLNLFKDIPKVFSSPVLSLMSPPEYPNSVKDTTQIGSLFTMFLCSPLKAFFFVSDILQVEENKWTSCTNQIKLFEKAVSNALYENLKDLGLFINSRSSLQDIFTR